MPVRQSGVQKRGKRRELSLRAALYCVFVAVWTFFAVLWGRLTRGPRHPGWGFRYEVAATVVRNVQMRVLKLPVVELRKYTLPTQIPLSVRRVVQHQRASLGGLYAEYFTPRRPSADKTTVLYFHGGGYIVCSPATHRELVSRIAASTGLRCIVVDYRKAPEYPYPTPIDDCEAAYRALLGEGVVAEDIILAGDSAGGGLVLSVLMRAREAGLPMPSSAVLLSPWVDLSCAGESVQSNAQYDYLSPESLTFAVEHYLQGQECLHPEVSHLQAELKGLPPLLVLTGTAELFYSENQAFVARAREHGVQVTHHVESGMVHVSALFAGFAPISRSTFEHIAQFVRERTTERAHERQLAGVGSELRVS